METKNGFTSGVKLRRGHRGNRTEPKIARAAGHTPTVRYWPLVCAYRIEAGRDWGEAVKAGYEQFVSTREGDAVGSYC